MENAESTTTQSLSVSAAIDMIKDMEQDPSKKVLLEGAFYDKSATFNA